MFRYLCVLKIDNGFTYHFFADQTTLHTYVKDNADRVWRLYKLSDVTDYWMYWIKDTLANDKSSTDTSK